MVGEIGDGLKMLVLVSQSLASSKATGVEVASQSFLVSASVGLKLLRSKTSDLSLSLGIGHLSMMGEELLKVLGTQDANLGQEQFALDKGSRGVVKDGPYRDQVLKLTAGLFDDAVLALENDGHARKIGNFSVADDQGVDVEATGSENTGDT